MSKEITDEQLDQMVMEKMAANLIRPQADISDEELDQMVIKKLMEQQIPKGDNAGQAAMEGFGQGATLGYLPHIQAATYPIIEKVGNFITGDDTDEQLEKAGFNIKQAPDDYLSRRDENILRQKQLQESNPVAYTGGNIGGALSTAMIPGQGAAKGASFLLNTAKAAGVGGAYGLLQNPGDIEGEINPVQLDERLGNAKTGAAMGGAIGGAAQVIGKGYQAVKNSPKALKSMAELRALKSAGAMLKDFRKTLGKKTANRIGRTLLDDDIVKFGDTFDDIAEKAMARKEQVGQEIGDLYQDMDNAITGLDRNSLTPSQFKQLAHSRLDAPVLAKQFKREISQSLKGVPGGRATERRISEFLDEFAENGNNLSLNRLREIRSGFDDLVNWSKQNADLPKVQQQLVKIRSKLNDKISQRIDAYDNILGGSSQSQKLKSLNQKFSDLIEVETIAKDRIARETANRSFSLGDRMGGLGGVVAGASAAGGPGAVVGGLAMAGLSKVARQYGGAALAKTADTTANILSSTPEVLGKFADPIMKAATQSPEKMVALIQKLKASDPDFMRMIRTHQRNDYQYTKSEPKKRNRKPGGKK